MNSKDKSEFYDVGERYFGVSIDNNKLEHNSCKDMCCSLQNILIERVEAIQFIEELCKSEEGVWYCSVEAIKGRDIKDYIGRKIFETALDNLTGWIFMWDKQPFANWSHECEYFFVYGNKEYAYSLLKVGLAININMTQI